MIGLLSPVLILLGFAVVLLAILTILEHGRRRSPGGAPATHPIDLVTWADVARRLGGPIDDHSDRSRINFKWNGHDAFLINEWPLVFKIAGGSFGSLNVEFVAPDGVLARDQTVQKPEDFRVMGVRGNLETSRAFLSPSARRILRDLVANAGGQTRVLIHDVFRAEGKPPRDPKNLARFAMLCLQLAQHAKLFADPPISVVDARSSSSGTCQVCGCDLGGPVVRCRRCSTLHHADCWEYTGMCSTYGCREKVFVS